jgi:hypothetical protein
MPATEQTKYDQKLMHVVFGVTGLVMLLSTIWMFAKDHNREWKKFQRQGRSVDAQMTQWRIREADTRERQAAYDEISGTLAQIQAQAPEVELVDAFQREVSSEAERLQRSPPNFAKLDRIYEDLIATALVAAEQREAAATAQAEVGNLRSVVESQRESLEQAAEDQRDAAEVAYKESVNRLSDAVAAASEAEQLATEVEEKAARQRVKMLAPMQSIYDNAELRERILSTDRKFKSADYDAARASQGLAVRDGRQLDERDLQGTIYEIKEGLDDLTLQRQASTSHRERLQEILAAIRAGEVLLAKELDDNMADLDRLEATLHERTVTYFTSSFPYLGKKLLELPIVDAFGSPLKIDNRWIDGLMQPNGSFAQIRRFDRCTTCHRAIDKTMPGSAIDPDYKIEHEYQFTLFTPSQEPQTTIDEAGNEVPPSLERDYGIRLSPGLLDEDEVTVSYVEPNSLAANALMQNPNEGEIAEHGLRVGDILAFVGKDKVLSAQLAENYLMYGLKWGEPVTLTVRRGLPNPYCSHPRLDLFVGSLSPHKVSEMGCTICHEGQGSATDFKWASHTPNDPAEGADWARDHGWFNNHHWIYPMNPARFSQSTCLKCHHDVSELEPSERFPDPPAPKLMAGYHLIESYGCFGCHEMNGYDGPDRRIGPDMRLEPNYYAAAAALEADPNFGQLTQDQQRWAEVLSLQPYRNDVRHQLHRAVVEDSQSEEPVLTSRSHELASALEDVETPGTYRKRGPTLRYVAAKLGESFLYDWIRDPTHFRPSTRMPRFFGQWDHLEDGDRDVAARYEPIEILGIVRYLVENSQSFDYLPAEEGIEHGSGAEQIERGKLMFETRGCLACHRHKDFPQAVATFAPDLSNVGDKLSAGIGTPNGTAWLYSWIKQPTHYNPRTKMPNLFLDPITDENGRTTDPAADIVTFLMSNADGWHPEPSTDQALALDADTLAALDDLALEHLSSAFFAADAEYYLQNGIPESMASSLKGAEIELVGSADDAAKLRYIGRKTIGKYGCYGCHDIPGFETAKPIGTALADWGRKETSKLAFEHILEYLHNGGHGHGSGHEDHGGAHSETDGHHEMDGEGHHEGDDYSHDEHGDEEFDESFYVQALNSHEREGFIWQKLKEPRSYDYKRTANKGYNERLRMPRFPLSPSQREEVVTFVLGLVADPPAEDFVYEAKPRNLALAEGRAALQKYNCAGCHILGLDTWELEFAEETFEGSPAAKDYPFMFHQFSAEELAKSAETDGRRGLYHASISGFQAISNEDGLPVVLDDEGDPIEEDEEYDTATLQYVFDLWKPATLEGHGYEVGVLPVTVPASTIVKKYAGWGGDLAKMLLPRVVELEKEVNPAANGSEAWGWLPPPLIGEGRKVQPEWLHSFLLDPYPIRPAVFLRMPKFNMSPDDATKIVNYFAAKDNVDFPFEFDPRQRAGHLVAAEIAYANRNGGDAGHLESAMKIVTNGNYCVKCHQVADFEPAGSVRAKSPDLSNVHQRLRPEYVRRWLANPKRVLPYTNMPVNLPFDADLPHLGGVDQGLYAGTSIEQLDALVDLLMNYPAYASGQAEISGMVELVPETEEGANSPDDASEARASPEEDDLSNLNKR